MRPKPNYIFHSRCALAIVLTVLLAQQAASAVAVDKDDPELRAILDRIRTLTNPEQIDQPVSECATPT